MYSRSWTTSEHLYNRKTNLFFSCIVRAYCLSEGTWSTVHKETTNAQRHAWKTSLEDSTYFPCYQSAVWSGKCWVWSVEWKVRSVECKVWSVECVKCKTSQYYFVPQSLHKALPSTTLYCKACTKHFPVLLCTTKLAETSSQYNFVLQSLHKVLPSNTLYYKACTKHFPVQLCTTKLAQTASQHY